MESVYRWISVNWKSALYWNDWKHWVNRWFLIWFYLLFHLNDSRTVNIMSSNSAGQNRKLNRPPMARQGRSLAWFGTTAIAGGGVSAIFWVRWPLGFTIGTSGSSPVVSVLAVTPPPPTWGKVQPLLGTNVSGNNLPVAPELIVKLGVRAQSLHEAL